jgi:NAD(P)-dependent dehydrogenase (short-subunit alcohol dehydrogenase family)
MDFDGKVALVTGTAGFARASALRLAEGGATVLACGIDEAAHLALAADAGMRWLAIHPRKTYVSLPDEVEAAVAEAVRRFGRLDIVVNAAAVHPYGTVVSTDFETWQRCMAVNVGSISSLRQGARQLAEGFVVDLIDHLDTARARDPADGDHRGGTFGLRLHRRYRIDEDARGDRRDADAGPRTSCSSTSPLPVSILWVPRPSTSSSCRCSRRWD